MNAMNEIFEYYKLCLSCVAKENFYYVLRQAEARGIVHLCLPVVIALID